MIRIFDSHKHSLKINLRTGTRSCCLLILICLMSFSVCHATKQPDKDSLTVIEEPQLPPKASDAVYTDPDYFSNIPVEQSDSTVDTTVMRQAFQQMNATYQSEDFNYEEDKINRLSWWERLKRNVKDFLISLAPNLHFNLKKIFYFILIGIGVLALAYIIYRLITNGKNPLYKVKKETTDNSPDWVEKNLMDINLNTHLEEAMEEKNYRLAIRYLHLINLKTLAQSNQIEWDIQKTNHEFLYEINDSGLKKDFSTTIIVYEHIWYGGFDATESQFEQYSALFNEFKMKITKKRATVLMP